MGQMHGRPDQILHIQAIGVYLYLCISPLFQNYFWQ